MALIGLLLPSSLWGVTAVSSTVSLEFWTASPANIPVTVEIRQGNLTVQTTTVNLTANGGYTVPLLQPLDYGTYTVTIKASHVDLNYVLVRFATTDPTADLDGSGVVDFPDISIVLLNFTMQGAPPANNGAEAPTLQGLSGNGRNLLFLDLGQGGNPYAPYRAYRKAGETGSARRWSWCGMAKSATVSRTSQR